MSVNGSGALALAGVPVAGPADVIAAADEMIPGHLSPAGYELPATLTYERWAEIGTLLQGIQGSINWWVGDWGVRGEQLFSEDAYQTIVSDAALQMGRSEDSILQAVWVASRFSPERRYPPSVLSWSHHRAVLLADLPPGEQDALLRLAAGIDTGVRLSTRELTDAAQARKDALARDPADLIAPPTRPVLSAGTQPPAPAGTYAGDGEAAEQPEPAPLDVDQMLDVVSDLAVEAVTFIESLLTRVRGDARHLKDCRIGRKVEGYIRPEGAPCSDACAVARDLVVRAAALFDAGDSAEEEEDAEA